ncbi:dethiobiotin synthase [Vibrio eleionomae]|nr:dethiobiotin synthase [Vibrio eleionomae]
MFRGYSSMSHVFFIAGTDTDVGKTVTSKAILQAFAAQGLTTVGYKPISAGCEKTTEGFRNDDALQLMKAATQEVPYEKVNPYALELPASPHIAADYEHISIEYSVLSSALKENKKKADVVVVEGAGGWRVPISRTECLSAWVKKEKIPVILVVGIKLGCLNHAFLTAEAIKADGLELAGWVANRINPGTEHYADIIDILEQRLGAPKLGEIPYLLSARRQDLGKYIHLDALVEEIIA